MWYLKNTNFPVPDHWCRDILPWERRQSQGVAVVWIFSLCQGGLLHVLMLLISQGKQRLPATLKISSHLFLSFLLNLVPLFLRLPSKEWRIGSELFFLHTPVRDSSHPHSLHPQQKHSTEIIDPLLSEQVTQVPWVQWEHLTLGFAFAENLFGERWSVATLLS